MIIGHGMLARAFEPVYHTDAEVVVFASGVSDSGSTDPARFQREQTLLEESIACFSGASRFLYFGTCSVIDPDSREKPYAIHKKSMESITLSHPGGLVIRLPQVAGPNASPNTLLAALVARMRSGQRITVWRQATRNIIDVSDVVKIVSCLLSSGYELPRIVNIASPQSLFVLDIVRTVASVLKLSPSVEIIEKGAAFQIPTPEMDACIDRAGVDFSVGYLARVVGKYYA